MIGVPIQTMAMMMQRKIMNFLWVGQEYLGVLLQQPMQIGGATLLGTNPQKIWQSHAWSNAPIKLPISKASKP